MYIVRLSFKAFQVSLYRVVQSHVKGVAYKRMAYADLVQPWYVLVEIVQVYEAEVVPGIESETHFTRHPGRLYKRFYGFLAVEQVA